MRGKSLLLQSNFDWGEVGTGLCLGLWLQKRDTDIIALDGLSA